MMHLKKVFKVAKMKGNKNISLLTQIPHCPLRPVAFCRPPLLLVRPRGQVSVLTKMYVVNVLIMCAVVFQLQYVHKKGNDCPLKCSSERVVTAGHTECGRSPEQAYLNTNTNTSKWDELPLCLSCYGSSLQQ